jgi:hypothetical protein
MYKSWKTLNGLYWTSKIQQVKTTHHRTNQVVAWKWSFPSTKPSRITGFTPKGILHEMLQRTTFLHMQNYLRLFSPSNSFRSAVLVSIRCLHVVYIAFSWFHSDSLISSRVVCLYGWDSIRSLPFCIAKIFRCLRQYLSLTYCQSLLLYPSTASVLILRIFALCKNLTTCATFEVLLTSFYLPLAHWVGVLPWWSFLTAERYFTVKDFVCMPRPVCYVRNLFFAAVFRPIALPFVVFARLNTTRNEIEISLIGTTSFRTSLLA